MATHTIMLPDWRYGRARRTILWDDEAGTFSGDHGDVPWLNEQVAGRDPGWLVKEGLRIWLEDPAHRPGDLIWLLGYIWAGVHRPGEVYQGITVTLPPVFDGGETESESTWPMITFLNGDKEPCPVQLIDEDGEMIGFPPPNAEYTLTDEPAPGGASWRTTDGHIIRFCLA